MFTHVIVYIVCDTTTVVVIVCVYLNHVGIALVRFVHTMNITIGHDGCRERGGGEGEGEGGGGGGGDGGKVMRQHARNVLC